MIFRREDSSTIKEANFKKTRERGQTFSGREGKPKIHKHIDLDRNLDPPIKHLKDLI